jgi:hypothetical protein
MVNSVANYNDNSIFAKKPNDDNENINIYNLYM